MGNARQVGGGGSSGGGGGAGTVTSVGLTLPDIFTVTGSPVTTAGDLAAALATQAPNLVLAGPASGGSTAPGFRALVANDIPTLTLSKISDAGTLASQNANAAAITGGTINGAVIGGVTPAAITGTIITATTRLVSPIHAPASDSTTAVRFTKADGSTAVVTVDTTNSKVGIGGTPTYKFHVFNSADSQGIILDRAGFTFPRLVFYNGATPEGYLYYDTSASQLILNRSGAATGINIDSSNRVSITGHQIATIPAQLYVNSTAQNSTSSPPSFTTSDAMVVDGTALSIIQMLSSATGQAYLQFSRGGASATRAIGYMLYDFTSDYIAFSVNAAERLRISNVGALTSTATDAVTAAVTNVLTVDHSSSGTPAASYGTGISILGQSSTTASQNMARIRTSWQTATHASRKSELFISVFSAATEFDVINIIQSSGTPPTVAINSTSPGQASGLYVQNPAGAAGGISTLIVRGVGSQTGALLTVASQGQAGSGLVALHVVDTGSIMGAIDAGTGTVTNVLTLQHTPTGAGTNGVGTGVLFQARSSTTLNVSQARIRSLFVDATHASRTSRLILSAFDTAERDALTIEANGTNPMIGVLGAAASARIAVSGSRDGNAALASLLTALATFGFITDSTTA